MLDSENENSPPYNAATVTMPALPDTSGAGNEAVDRNLSVNTIRNYEQWTAMEHEWRALFHASPTASPPLRWEWQRDWWRLYAPVCTVKRANDDGLRIVTVRRDGRLVGLLPLYVNTRGSSPVRSRTLMWISTGEPEHEELCAEYPDLLHLPEEGGACARAILSALCEDRNADWDQLDLLHLAGNSPVLKWAGEASLPNLEIRPQGSAYVADLNKGFEGYLERLSHNSRSLARKQMRRSERAGATLDIAHDIASAEQMLMELRRLHQERWTGEGQPGCFSSARFEEFHRAQALRGVLTGEAVLACLRRQDETLAVLLGYTAAGKFDSYVAGARTDELASVKSPGIVLHLLLTEHLSLHGVCRYDHLAGDARYKQQFTSDQIPRFSVHFSRPTLRTALGRTLELARGAARRGKRLLAAGQSAPSKPSGSAEEGVQSDA